MYIWIVGSTNLSRQAQDYAFRRGKRQVRHVSWEKASKGLVRPDAAIIVSCEELPTRTSRVQRDLDKIDSVFLWQPTKGQLVTLFSDLVFEDSTEAGFLQLCEEASIVALHRRDGFPSTLVVTKHDQTQTLHEIDDATTRPFLESLGL